MGIDHGPRSSRQDRRTSGEVEDCPRRNRKRRARFSLVTCVCRSTWPVSTSALNVVPMSEPTEASNFAITPSARPTRVMFWSSQAQTDLPGQGECPRDQPCHCDQPPPTWSANVRVSVGNTQTRESDRPVKTRNPQQSDTVAMSLMVWAMGSDNTWICRPSEKTNRRFSSSQ